MILKISYLPVIIILLTSSVAYAETINWHSYEERKSNEFEKPFFIYFYNSYSLPEIDFFNNDSLITTVNNKYFPVKINIDEPDGRILFNNISKFGFRICPNEGTMILILNSKFQFLESQTFCEGGISNNLKFLDILNKYGHNFESHNIGKVTIEEYNNFIDMSQNQNNIEIKANLSKLKVIEITDSAFENQLIVTLDDGTGTLKVLYNESHEKIETGDIINIEIINDGRLTIPKINKIESIKTVGSSQIFIIVAIFLLLFVINKTKL